MKTLQRVLLSRQGLGAYRADPKQQLSLEFQDHLLQKLRSGVTSP